MPGPAKPGASMPGPAKPGASQPGPVDPKLAALIARPVSVVEAEPERGPRESTAFDPDEGRGGRRGRGGQPARQPEKGRKPELFRPAAQAAALQNKPIRIVREGDIECPNCHQGNYPWRTFCRACGLELEQAKKAAERHTFWRWLWNWMAAPVHARRRRVVNAGGRPGRKYRQSQGAQRMRLTGRGSRPKVQWPRFDRSRVKKIAPILVIVLALFFAFGPWHKTTRHYFNNVKGWVQGLEPHFVQLYPIQQTATIEGATKTPKGDKGVAALPSVAGTSNGPVGNIDDGDTTTFWAGNSQIPITVRVPYHFFKTVTGPGGGKHKVRVDSFYNKSEMSAPGVGTIITLSYDSPQPFRAVSLIPGDQFPTSQFNKFGRPANVELIFSKGAPIFYTVPNAPDFNKFTFLPHTSTFVQLKILSTYPGSQTGPQFCAITEFAAYTETG